MAELADAIVESGRQTLIAAAKTASALEAVGLLYRECVSRCFLSGRRELPAMAGTSKQARKSTE